MSGWQFDTITSTQFNLSPPLAHIGFQYDDRVFGNYFTHIRISDITWIKRIYAVKDDYN